MVGLDQPVFHDPGNEALGGVRPEYSPAQPGRSTTRLRRLPGSRRRSIPIPRGRSVCQDRPAGRARLVTLARRNWFFRDLVDTLCLEPDALGIKSNQSDYSFPGPRQRIYVVVPSIEWSARVPTRRRRSCAVATDIVHLRRAVPELALPNPIASSCAAPSCSPDPRPSTPLPRRRAVTPLPTT
jgi:hypothetical protein